MAQAKTKRGLFSRAKEFYHRFDRTTVKHVGRGGVVSGRTTTGGTFKGYRIYKTADGGFTVPELDSGSVFEDKTQAKRFIGEWTKRRGNPMKRHKRGRNPRTWRTFTARDVGKYKEGFGIVQARDVGKKYYIEDGSYFVENDAQMAKRLGKSVNPRGGGLIPAKLKRMPNGTYKVYVAPGAMVKLNPTPKVERAYRTAVAADDAFQQALEKEYGKRAGDMRYHTKEQPPHIQALGRKFQDAMEKSRAAVAEMRKGNSTKR